jgi:hypothetical protein
VSDSKQQAKATAKTTTSPLQWFFVLVFIFLTYKMCSGSESNRVQPKVQLTAEDITRKCAFVAGIPADSPKHAISSAQMKTMLECVDQYLAAQKASQ